MNLQLAKEQAESLIAEKLPSWTFDWITSKHVRGRCNYTKKTIYLSSYCTYRRKPKNVLNTTLHEIAHAITGHGHDNVWRECFIGLGGNGMTHSDDKLK